jgi:hypothetical protein
VDFKVFSVHDAGQDGMHFLLSAARQHVAFGSCTASSLVSMARCYHNFNFCRRRTTKWRLAVIISSLHEQGLSAGRVIRRKVHRWLSGYSRHYNHLWVSGSLCVLCLLGLP